jgi:hypothetical protein
LGILEEKNIAWLECYGVFDTRGVVYRVETGLRTGSDLV